MTIESAADRSYRLMKAIKRYKRMGWSMGSLLSTLSGADASDVRACWELIKA